MPAAASRSSAAVTSPWLAHVTSASSMAVLPSGYRASARRTVQSMGTGTVMTSLTLRVNVPFGCGAGLPPVHGLRTSSSWRRQSVQPPWRCEQTSTSPSLGSNHARRPARRRGSRRLRPRAAPWRARITIRYGGRSLDPWSPTRLAESTGANAGHAGTLRTSVNTTDLLKGPACGQ
jgi:hypothetical protein